MGLFMNIYIQTNLVAGLIGKSHFNKTIDSFVNLLNINTKGYFNLHGESTINDHIVDSYISNLCLPHDNVNDVKKALDSIAILDVPIHLAEQLKKHVICSFGKRNEKVLIQKYFNITVNPKQFKSIEIFKCKYFNVILNGTPDLIDKNTIVEIKNRIHSLSKTIKDCDYIQLQIYLNMFEVENGKLIEGIIMSNDIIESNTYEIRRDKLEYEQICKQLIRPCILVYKLITDTKLRMYFDSISKIEKNAFINSHFEYIDSYITGFKILN